MLYYCILAQNGHMFISIKLGGGVAANERDESKFTGNITILKHIVKASRFEIGTVVLIF